MTDIVKSFLAYVSLGFLAISIGFAVFWIVDRSICELKWKWEDARFRRRYGDENE